MKVKDAIAAARADIDAEFAKKYPNGQFVLQIRNGYEFKAGLNAPITEQSHYYIHWNPRRRTSRSSPHGISLCYHLGMITIDGYQNNSWGKIKYCDSLENMITSANRAKFPLPLIYKFRECYFALTCCNHANGIKCAGFGLRAKPNHVLIIKNDTMAN